MRNKIILIFTLSVVLSSCKKDYKIGIEPSCNLTEFQDTSPGDSPYILSYDFQDRLTNFLYATSIDTFQIGFNYEKDKINEYRYSGGETITYTFSLDVNEMPDRRTSSYFNGSTTLYDTVYYEYNKDGFLIKSIRRNGSYVGVDYVVDKETIYQSLFANGNKVASIKTFISGTTSVYNYQYEYYADKLNRQNADLFFKAFDSGEDNEEFLDIIGKHNSNLLKRIVATHSGSPPDTINFSYELDQYEYIKKIIIDYGGGSGVTYNLQYDCKD
jgi:hypothetical protein